VLEPKAPVSDVTVCGASVPFVQVTVAPAGTVVASGVKA
jgi:hypothetical protein